MNGTVVFGVALIIMGLFFGGQWMLGLLIAGVAVAAFGAFGPSPKRAPARPMPAEDEPFV
ncbi:MAG TPA: hypothetical protein VH120_09450 [Gemmataceae bacterium]|jgi:hypothetical protein|nr:hypothetical protein [Gemmataceae bacterium]